MKTQKFHKISHLEKIERIKQSIRYKTIDMSKISKVQYLLQLIQAANILSLDLS
jgi:hypothetical protein